MVAYETNRVFVQLWIGAEDKQPRMQRAVYFDDPVGLRHQVEFREWKIDRKLGEDAITSKAAASASPVAFEHPKSKQARWRQDGAVPGRDHPQRTARRSFLQLR